MNIFNHKIKVFEFLIELIYSSQLPENFNTHKMGGHESKIKNPSANVINDIVIKVEIPILYLIIIICLLSIQILITLYQLHKRSLKKSYTRSASRATDLDKI